ncbi:hypothetical protein FKM82_005733 [Ascaphus truei]
MITSAIMSPTSAYLNSDLFLQPSLPFVLKPRMSTLCTFYFYSHLILNLLRSSLFRYGNSSHSIFINHLFPFFKLS